MSNRRDFLKLLGLGAIAPIVPKIPIAPTAPAVTSTLLAGKIKTGGLIAKIDGSERMGIRSNGIVDIHDEYMKKFNQMYEQQIWSGNPITNKNI